VAQNTLIEHVMGLQQAFIMAKSEQEQPAVQWTDFHIPMYILNEQRLKRAFTLPFPRSETINPAKVNSILRPTFPTLPAWYVRMAF